MVDLARCAALLALVPALLLGCQRTSTAPSSGDAGDADSDTDSDVDSDTDADTDTGTDSDTGQGPPFPETCEQAEQMVTTVGCLFYAVDLDSHDNAEGQQFGVAVANVTEADTASVSAYQGSASGDWELVQSFAVPPLWTSTIELPDYNMNSSGLMPGGSFRIESDVPLAAFQLNPSDGAETYLSDASALIPAPSLGAVHHVVGWEQGCLPDNHCDGDMRAYFTVVATVDGTEVQVTPAMSPLEGDPVPTGVETFSVAMDEGDVLEVQTDQPGDSMTGSRVESDADHPIAVFTGSECADVPAGSCCCDHLEEQLPGLAHWGTEFAAARLPVRCADDLADPVLFQIYAAEDGTEVDLTAAAEVSLPFETTTLDQGEWVELLIEGTTAEPGDLHITASAPIAVMQYMTGIEYLDCTEYNEDLGDPSMVWVVPTEQLLPRHVILAPQYWDYQYLVITRPAGAQVLLDDEPVADGEFQAIADSGFEVARVEVDNDIHVVRSAEEAHGLGVIVVGWKQWDSYAYLGGMLMAPTNSKYY
jgi:hypothetical protein